MASSENASVEFPTYDFQGQPLSLENLGAWLQDLDEQRLIPYDGRVETDAEVRFTLCYNGGWGLGYITDIIYTKATGKWTVACMVDGTILEDEVEGKRAGDLLFGGVLRIEELGPDGDIVVSSTSNTLNHLVEIGMYYSLELMRIANEHARYTSALVAEEQTQESCVHKYACSCNDAP